MADPTPAVTPGAQTSEFALAKVLAFVGFGMILGSVALSVFHPLPDVSSALLRYGATLMGTAGTAYGLFRTGLKYAAIAKQYEPEAEAVAAVIPGQVGADIRHALPTIEKLVDAVVTLGGQAQAAQAASSAVAAAVATPVATASSPVAPGAA